MPDGSKFMAGINLFETATLAILAQQNPFVIPMIEPAKKVFAAGGVKVLDTVIYNPDQPDTNLFLVIAGRVKVSRVTDDGRQVWEDV